MILVPSHQRFGADVTGQFPSSRRSSCLPHRTGLPLRPSCTGTQIALAPVKTAIRAREHRASTSGMSPRQTSAPSMSTGKALNSGPQRRAQALGVGGIGDRSTSRPRNAAAIPASASCPVTTETGRAPLGKRSRGNAAYHRLAADRVPTACCAALGARSGLPPARCRDPQPSRGRGAPDWRSSANPVLAPLHGGDLGDDGERDLG